MHRIKYTFAITVNLSLKMVFLIHADTIKKVSTLPFIGLVRTAVSSFWVSCCWLSFSLLTKTILMSHVMRKPVYVICEQQRRRSACASAQSDQRLCFRCLHSIIPPLAIAEVSSLYLVSVTAQTGLSLPWSQTPKTGFLVTRFIYIEKSMIRNRSNRVPHPAQDTKREWNANTKGGIKSNTGQAERQEDSSFPADDH